MKKTSARSLHETRVNNPRHTYSMVVTWKNDREKEYEVVKLASRELDIHEKARKIFYRIVKEKTGILLHNLQKPYEQDRHDFTRKKGTLTRKAIKAPSSLHSFEYTYCTM